MRNTKEMWNKGKQIKGEHTIRHPVFVFPLFLSCSVFLCFSVPLLLCVLFHSFSVCLHFSPSPLPVSLLFLLLCVSLLLFLFSSFIYYVPPCVLLFCSSRLRPLWLLRVLCVPLPPVLPSLCSFSSQKLQTFSHPYRAVCASSFLELDLQASHCSASFSLPAGVRVTLPFNLLWHVIIIILTD